MNCFHEEGMIFRIGGDEFAAILPCGEFAAVEKSCCLIRNDIIKYNEENTDIPLSLSIGFAIGEKEKTL